MNQATERKRRQFDRERARRGQPDALPLIKYDGETPPLGYITLQTITGGWYGAPDTLKPTGENIFQVRIAEQDGQNLDGVFGDQLSHLKIGDLFYSFRDAGAPTTATRVWTIICAATGESAPSD